MPLLDNFCGCRRRRLLGPVTRSGPSSAAAAWASYAALDHQRNEEVAFKRLLTERYESSHELARATSLFEREYHTLSELAHARINRVFDYGVDGGGPFYTMERLHGRSLRDCAPLPWRADRTAAASKLDLDPADTA